MIFQKCVDLPDGIQCASSVTMLKPGISNYFQVPVINESNHNSTIMKKTVISNLEYVTLIEVRANTGDSKRAGNAAMNKVEVVKLHEPTPDSKEDSASGNDDHYRKL